MPGLYTGASGLWGGFAGLLYGPSALSTPPGLLADAGGFTPASLFAQGEQGVWYDPSDFSTMFQDAAGTTPVTAVEQPVGLLLDKSQGLVLGSELVTNGTFDANVNGWTQIGGGSFAWDPSGGIACTDVGGADCNAQTNITTVAGRTYRIQWTVRSATGGWLFRIRNSTDYNYQSLTATTGTFTAYFVASVTGTNTVNLLSNDTNQTVVFDNVSVKLLPGNHATQSTTASRPVLSARVNLLTYSEQFDNAAWGKASGTSVSANTTTAPDGTLTADTITSVNSGEITQTITGVNGVTYRASLSFAKTSGATVFPMLAVNGSALFGQVIINTNTGVAAVRSGVPGATSVTVTDQNTFWRLAFNLAIDTTSIAVKVYPAASTNGTSFTGGLSGSCVAWGADLRPANQVNAGMPNYQRIAAATDYDTTGFPLYLRFDGTDDSMATATINPGSVDKVQVFAGVRKLSDAAASVFVEYSADINANAGTFGMYPQGNAHIFGSRGTVFSGANYASATPYSSPITNVITGLGDISGDRTTLRINGTQAAQSTADQGTGNYGSYPLYIGRRAGTSLPFNGHLYSLIARFGANLPDATIAQTETWVNGKTLAY